VAMVRGAIRRRVLGGSLVEAAVSPAVNAPHDRCHAWQEYSPGANPGASSRGERWMVKLLPASRGPEAPGRGRSAGAGHHFVVLTLRYDKRIFIQAPSSAHGSASRQSQTPWNCIDSSKGSAIGRPVHHDRGRCRSASAAALRAPSAPAEAARRGDGPHRQKA
jgi:hypothetical protein